MLSAILAAAALFASPVDAPVDSGVDVFEKPKDLDRTCSTRACALERTRILYEVGRVDGLMGRIGC